MNVYAHVYMFMYACVCITRMCVYVYAYAYVGMCSPHTLPPSLPTDLVLDVGIRAVRFQEIREVGGTVASGHVQRSLPARVLFVGVVLGLQQQLAQTFELVLRRDVQWVVAVVRISDVL